MGNYRTFRHAVASRHHEGGNDETSPSARMISDIEGTSSAIARDEWREYVGSCCAVGWGENHSPAMGIRSSVLSRPGDHVRRASARTRVSGL